MLSMLPLLVFVGKVMKVHAEMRPEVTFRFLAPSPGRIPQTLEVSMASQLNYLFYTLTCRSPGNDVTVRINPGDQTMELVDGQSGITRQTLGAKSCLPSGARAPVSCTYTSYCQLHNECVATLRQVCGNNPTQYADLTVSVVDDQLTVSRCYAMCGDVPDSGGDDSDSGHETISDLAVGLIVAGAVVLACLIIAGAVVFQIKRAGHSKTFNDSENNNTNKLKVVH